MDTILMAVTVLSLALVAGMGAVLARMLREERRRSDARVALLAELASEPVPRRAHADTMVNTADLELRPTAPAAETAALFREHEQPSAWPRRLAVAGTMAALVSIVMFGWTAVARDVSSRAAASASTVTQPLELLSLSHTQEAGSITISGLVQNPRGGMRLSRVSATVVVFGSDGAQTTGRAPLDIVALAPGEGSPFVIRVPVTDAPARYRVAFRGEDDRALGHIDRRDPEAIAGKQEP